MREQSTKFNYELLKQLKGTICCNCRKECENEIIFHHIVPLGYGGNDVVTNIVPLCSNCHNKIHTITDNNGRISHSKLTKIGLERARAEGKQIGQKKGSKLNIKKKLPAKKIIYKNSIYFLGNLNNEQCRKLAHLANNTFYKYKKEMEQELLENPNADFTVD